MISADKIRMAVARRTLGYSLQSISRDTGISPRQLTTIFSREDVAKGGVNKEALQRAKSLLLNDKLLMAEMKKGIRLAIDAERAVSHAIIDSISRALEEVEALPVEKRCKALASLSASAAATFNGLRKLNGFDVEEKGNDSLPSLTILRMTESEIIEVQQAHEFNGGQDEDQDESTDEIVEEL